MSLSQTASVERRTPLAIGLFLSLRPRQWTKNLLVYMALLFTVNLYWDIANPGQLLRLAATASAAFAVFCVLSGGLYILNDVVDVARDRAHPDKRRRPIAAGAVSRGIGGGAASAALAVGVGLAFWLEPSFGAVSLGYVLLSLAYDLWLKHMVLIDVLVLSGGYLARAIAGAVVIGVPVSPWLYVCTLLLALFIGLCKRRAELVTVEAANPGGHSRPVLAGYSAHLLDQLIAVVTASTVMAYTLYTFTAPNLPSNHAMMATIPLALYGIFRYLYLVYGRNLGERPEEVLLTDPPLLVSIFLWGAMAGALLVIFR